MNIKIKRSYLVLLGFNRCDIETFNFINNLEWPKAETMWFARDYGKELDGRKS